MVVTLSVAMEQISATKQKIFVELIDALGTVGNCALNFAYSMTNCTAASMVN
jgi:hypothetical protein